MKKLLIFLMVAVPLVIIIIVNLTVNAVVGYVSISVDSVALDKSSIIANVDEKFVLNATIYPESATNKELVWKSDNEDVAVVDINGNVTFVGFGQGYITVTSVDGAKQARCYFYVTDTKVHQVVLYAPKSEIKIGETLQLNASVLPAEAVNKDIKFISSDESIARVDANGLVTGVGIGHASIIATSEDGGHSSYTTIAVINPVTGIVLDKQEIVTSQSYQTIKYTILPENASNKSVKFSVDSNIATVSNLGVVSFIAPGEVTVKLTTVDGGYTTECKVICTAGYARSLNLDTNSISATVGDSPVYINYTTEPSNIYATEIEFSSDDPDIAYVDESGYLQFVSGGNTMIRARINTSEDEYIESTISVYVASPAEAIVISNNLISAGDTFRLSPLSYPYTSTNEEFFYYSYDTSKATVDSDGNITFHTSSPCTVDFEIYANEDHGSVSKTVSVYYTGGYATAFDLVNDEITLKYGESKGIECKITPAEAIYNTFSYRVISEQKNGGGSGVISIRNDGTIATLGGGTAVVEVSLQLASGEVITKNCNVTVIRPVEQVRLITDLDSDERGLITALQTVSFDYEVLPLDATDKTILWSLSDETLPAPIGNTFLFNYPDEVKLIASSRDGGFTQAYTITYTGSSPTAASITEIPTVISYGDEIDIEVLSVTPSNAVYRNLSFYVSNQNTQSLNNKVLEIDGNTIKAVGGGTARLTVYVSSTVQLTYDITVIRQPESLSVVPSNITTSKTSLDLVATVLPYDTTDKSVIYTVDDESIAIINGSTIEFLQNGIVTVSARCVADDSIVYQFTLEKTNKSTGLVEPTKSSFDMPKGDSIQIDLSSYDTEYDYCEYSIVSQTPDLDGDVISLVEDGTISALNYGIANVSCVLYDQYGTAVKSFDYTINVVQLVERITLKNDFTYYNNAYVTAIGEVELDFNVYPDNANNKKVKYNIKNSYSSQGIANNTIAYIDEGKIYFNATGTVSIEAVSDDGNVSMQFNLRYTGGNALAASIDLDSSIMLNVGESKTVNVTEWIPHDTVNTFISLVENSTSGKRLLQVDGTTFTAVAGGRTILTVDLSNGITKNINVTISKNITNIQLDTNKILISQDAYTINPIITPVDATNRTLLYFVDDTSIATFNQETKTLNFVRPGTVVLKVMATDGSNVETQVEVTSTMGYINNFELNASEKTIQKYSNFSLYVGRYYPIDAAHKDISFRILSQTANDGSDNDVVTLNNGDIRGIYGGEAVIRAYTYDYDGNEVYADCKINVVTNVSEIYVGFDKYEEYQNSIITASYEVNFNCTIYPADATDKGYTYTIDNPDIAMISGNKILFLKEGYVTITFTANDTAKGTKYFAQKFLYTAGKIVDLTLEDNSKNINLRAGEVFEVKISKVVPADATNREIYIRDKNEIRIAGDKQVIEFEAGAIYGANGGVATFSLFAGVGYTRIGNYSVTVTREAESIYLSSDSFYTAIPTYNLSATVLPSDTNDKTLAYEIISNKNIAKINSQTGAITFSGMGVIRVAITSVSNPSLTKVVAVEYTRNVKSLHFADSMNSIFVGENGVKLSVLTDPLDAEGYEIVYSIDRPDIATLLTYNDGTCKVLGKGIGEVNVRAELKSDSSIYAVKTIYINDAIRILTLNLNGENNTPGIGGYRVFGNTFIINHGKGSFSYTNTYKMDYKVETASGTPDHVDLKWTSSDPSIATVDENGVVTFLSIGKVTITVTPAEQIVTNPKSDSYTFNVVSGVNIYTLEEYNLIASAEEGKERNVVLQADISKSNDTNVSNINVRQAMYGNGHMIDFTDSEGYSKVDVKASNVLIDNIILRGTTFKETAALSTLSGSYRIVVVYDNKENVVIRNSIIENGMIGCEAVSSDLRLEGCIIRNTFSGNIVATRESNHPRAANIVIKDCILAKALLSCILFNVDKSDNPYTQVSKIDVEGKLYVYNWIDPDDISGKLVTDTLNSMFAQSIVDDIVKSFKSTIHNNFPDYSYKYNGKDHYLLAAILYDVDYIAGRFKSNGVLSMTNMEVSEDYKPEFVFKSFTGAYKGAATYELGFVTTYGNKDPSRVPTITPSSTYDSTIYPTIRQAFVDINTGA